ncbi:DUF86 domain-containing protein [Paraburkholderia sacchari]|uniref:HepT-like ribonuclease domain-containing protein n=1 Tax=Paraburkholderia sacchari TaxID=159450 RepID=UPI0039A6007F
MSENRLPDYLDHIRQAAADAGFTQAHIEVPWRSMRNMRNRMAHGYFDINLDVVWATVQEWLPELLKQMPAVLHDANDGDRNVEGEA